MDLDWTILGPMGTIAGLFYMIIRNFKKDMKEEFKEIKNDIKNIDNRLSKIEGRLEEREFFEWKEHRKTGTK